PGAFGRVHSLGDEAVLVAVAFPDATFDAGVVTLELGPDGAADPAVVSLTDPAGEHGLEVEVQTLADAVQIFHAGR
ncbi:MAG TPA: hypothetical protein VLC53_04610, partial [Myxococcota bacterium]|nr:hypothetical protein [Myxococcota bacterium]